MCSYLAHPYSKKDRVDGVSAEAQCEPNPCAPLAAQASGSSVIFVREPIVSHGWYLLGRYATNPSRQELDSGEPAVKPDLKIPP